MNQHEPLEALANHAFLKGMSPAHLTALAGCTQRMTITAGQYLGREREPAQAFYLIQAGQVVIEIHKRDHGAVRLQTLGPGSIVGWSWLVPPHRWQFDARVAETVQVLALDADALRRQCEQDHELGYQLLKRLVAVIASRLAATRHEILERAH